MDTEKQVEHLLHNNVHTLNAEKNTFTTLTFASFSLVMLSVLSVMLGVVFSPNFTIFSWLGLVGVIIGGPGIITFIALSDPVSRDLVDSIVKHKAAKITKEQKNIDNLAKLQIDTQRMLFEIWYQQINTSSFKDEDQEDYLRAKRNAAILFIAIHKKKNELTDVELNLDDKKLRLPRKPNGPYRAMQFTRRIVSS